jgi:integrase/recombinase XerD
MKTAGRLAEDALSTQEIEALLLACSRRAATGIRNKALVALLWRCGLRLGEALALRPQDVDLDRGVGHVHWAKGGKQRVVGLDAGACALVADWLDVRALGVRSRSAPLFCTLGGGVIDQSYVRHLLPRLAQRAGIEKRGHAHSLRHAYAVALEREGARLSTIRDLLGHGSAAVTDRYLRRLGRVTASSSRVRGSGSRQGERVTLLLCSSADLQCSHRNTENRD